MYSKVNSAAIHGIDGIPVSIEVDISSGLPEFSLVGFLSSEVREARERVRTSLRNSGYALSARKITVNLAPADLRKEGTGFDLGIAVGILVSYELLPGDVLAESMFLGELGLDGSVCPVPGVLSAVISARDQGLKMCFVPESNASEGAVVNGMRIIGVKDLKHLAEILNNPEELKRAGRNAAEQILPDSGDSTVSIPENYIEPEYADDFADINGQFSMKRAAEVAAAGMHNLLFVGAPGSGKTMIAKRIPSILPALSPEESLEVTRIYSVCGMLPPDVPLIRERPFRSPHHTVSPQSLVGGGRIPRPGEVSLANRGVLFLDELPEFRKEALEALRQPLEDRRVTISRIHGSCSFPANVMLCAAMNPCRCGYYPDRNRCQCGDGEVRRYLQRISRPLLDRMDICVEAPPVGYGELGGVWANESSAVIRGRVAAAWNVQKERFKGLDIYFNSQIGSRDIKRWCELGAAETDMMEQVFHQMELSARAYHRVLKVARTIADLDGDDHIREYHLAEALGYRGLDRKFWG